jgi:endonuclease-8
MPEGDTIFRTARALNRALTGQPVAYFDSSLAALAQANDQTPFTGQTITKVESRGKWLLIHIANPQTPEAPAEAARRKRPVTRARLQPGQPIAEKKEGASAPATAHPSERILATHMLMSGSWHLYQPGDPWQDKDANARIILEVADYQAVGFRVPVARIYTPQTLARDKKIPHRPRRPPRRLRRPSRYRPSPRPHNDELGDAILRQDVLAGVGNVFKSEICFTLKLNPFRKVSTLTKRQAKQIVETAQKLLAANVLEDSDNLIVTYSGRNRRTTGASRSRRQPLGLRPQRRALPHLPNPHPARPPRPQRKKHLLVPPLPAGRPSLSHSMILLPDPPLTPIAPTTLPSFFSGMPPAKIMILPSFEA